MREVLKKKEKNCGIELLRLVSMLMIVLLHTLGEGGLLSIINGVNYKIGWLLEIISYSAVNVFALITGFVNYSDEDKKFSYSKYIFFWVPICFYSVINYVIISWYTTKSINLILLIKSFFPVLFAKYWYVNAYTGLFFLIPWINKLIRNCSKKETNELMVVIFIVFSLFSNIAIPFSDPFMLNRGYSVLWLIILYIIGAGLKKNQTCDKKSKKYWFFIFLLSVLIPWTIKVYSPIVPNIFICYISIMPVIASISLISLFSQIKIHKMIKKVILFLSPAAFGVYLIHSNIDFSSLFITKRFIEYASYPWYIFCFKVILTSLIIFISCLLLEKLRLYLFKVLKINYFIEYFKKTIVKFVSIFITRLNVKQKINFNKE